MKFGLFIHMERMDRSLSHEQAFADLTELVQIADAGGFQNAWIGEHHAMEFTIAPNPLVNLAYLAPLTKSIRLGTSTLIAPNWHPIRMAGETAMTDIACGGRLDICVARGAYTFEYERMVRRGEKVDAESASRALRELVPTLPKLWTGDYAHDGEFWSFPASTSVPRPVQSPHPPIWIAARDPNSHRFAIENGCNVQVTPLWRPDEEVERLMDRFNAACEAAPAVTRPRIMLLRHAYVASNAADADRASEELSEWYKIFMTWFKNESPIVDGFVKPPGPEQEAEMTMFTPEALRESLVIGTAEEVVERLRLSEALGYDQFAIWIDSGMSHARKRASLERFIADVAPAFA